MRFRKTSAALALMGVLLAAPGCKDFYDVNTDPIHPTTATLAQLLPVSQVAMSTYLGFNIQGLGQPTSALMGQLTNSRGIGTYTQDNNAFDTPWSGLYTDMLQNNEQIITQGTAEENWGYVGVAQLQKAYVFSQLVDAFGDVPYSQALKGTANLNPRFDDDADIYNGNDGLGIQSLFSLIDEGLANLTKPGVTAPSADIIYGGNLNSWQHFGRALKLKLYNQIRKSKDASGNTRDVSSEVRDLLTQPLLSSSENFEVGYGSSAAPENRHIGFLSDYVNTPPENSIGPYLYLLMRNGNGQNYDPGPAASPDPRIPYYFFNQYGSTADNGTFDYQLGRFVSTRPGSTSPKASTDNSASRTLPGLYPYGGRYDDNGNALDVTESSAPGNGIQRLYPYFAQKFTEAELQLTVLNDVAAAENAYAEAVRASYNEVNKLVTRVNSAGSAVVAPALTVPTDAAIRQKFTAASSTEDKLRVIMEQKYIASFGMGMDIFTDWRRTHYPVITVAGPGSIAGQPGLVQDSTGVSAEGITISNGVFPRRLYYPISDLNANLNPQAPRTNIQPSNPNDDSYRIFWDR